MKCWGITPGSAGMVSQVRALASALNLTPEMKTVTVKKPWAYLPNACYATPLARFVVPHFIKEREALSPPWPELVISCGRRGAIAALGLQYVIPSVSEGSQELAQDPSLMLGMTTFIHIQDPQVNPKHFDLVIAMEHDRITGPNVLKTRFALHGITPALLDKERQRFAPRFAAYEKPLVAVAIGGSTNKYTLVPEVMAQLILTLQRLVVSTGASLLITPSRRTGEANIAMLKQAFAGNACVYVYDGIEENPYLGLLALADYVVVTDDSVNMMSEAHATGKPLYLLRLPGHIGTKPARFADGLVKDGIARAWEGTLETWHYPARNEMEWLAGEVRGRLSL